MKANQQDEAPAPPPPPPDPAPPGPADQRAELEASLVGGLLAEPARTLEQVRTLVDLEAFEDPRARAVYRAILGLAAQGAPVEPLSLWRELCRRGGKRLFATDAEFLEWGAIESAPLSDTTIRLAREIAAQNLQERRRRAAQAYSRSPSEANLARLREVLTEELPHLDAPSSWAELAEGVEAVTWCWHRWLARAFLTLCVGGLGVGKSALLLRIAACFLRGDPWPDGTPFEGNTGEVVWVETEAAQAIHLQRAKAWGLPLERLRTPLPDPLAAVSLDDEAHREILARVASRPETRIVIVDSLSGSHRRDENTTGMLPVVNFLAELARDRGIPVLASHLLRKRSLADPDPRFGVDLDRVRGSTSILQPARVVWTLDLPAGPDAEARLEVRKSNIAAPPEPLGMVIGEAGELTFGPPPAVPEMGATAEAKRFLLQLLDRAPLPTNQVLLQANAAGHAERTTRRAARSLSVVPIRKGNRWFWSLPARREDGGE